MILSYRQVVLAEIVTFDRVPERKKWADGNSSNDSLLSFPTPARDFNAVYILSDIADQSQPSPHPTHGLVDVVNCFYRWRFSNIACTTI